MNIVTAIAYVALSLQSPEGDRGKLVAEWAKALEKPDFQSILRFHLSAPWKQSAADAASEDFRFTRRAGGFLKVRDLLYRNGRSEMLLKSRDIDEYLVISVGPDQNDQLRPQVRTPMRAELTEVPKATADSLASRVKSHIESLGKAGRFNGTIAVAKGDRILYQGQFGLAHRGFKVPNKFDTKFNLASMGKMFTAVAVGQLVDQGKLSFDTTVGKVLPSYPNETVREKVTVRMLLNHTSGLGDMFTPMFIEGSKDRWKTIDSMLPLFQSDKLRFEPGKGNAYSNAGYVLLGKMIEQVSGKEYWAYLQDAIFNRLGMNDTGAFEMDQDTPNLAFGYTHDSFDGSVNFGEPKNNLFMHIAKGSPAGGSFSTVPDLLKFASALRTNKLLKLETFKTLTTAQDGQPNYGLGFQLRTAGKDVGFGHSGGFPGINGELIVYMPSGYTVVALANYDSEASMAAGRVRMLIADVLSVE